MHHHCLWQTEFLQLPQEVHPLLCSFCEDVDVQPPLEDLADGGAQESEGLHNVHWGVVQGDGGGWGSNDEARILITIQTNPPYFTSIRQTDYCKY